MKKLVPGLPHPTSPLLPALFFPTLVLALTACASDGASESGTSPEGGSTDTESGSTASEGTEPATDTESTETDAPIPNLHDVPTDVEGGVRMCAELGSLCHAFDRGANDLGTRCHQIGHEGDPEACAEIYDECIAFCQEPVDAGVEDSGHHDQHTEGGAQPGHHDAPELCEALGHLCHDLDTGEGLARECHEVGHAGEATACAAIYDECIALCAGDGGHGHDEHEGGVESSHDGNDASTHDGG